MAGHHLESGFPKATHGASPMPGPQEYSPSRRIRLAGLDSLRCYAATSIILFHLVLVGHVLLPVSVDFVRSYFGFGVPLFFVVSAFSITYGYVDQISGNRDVEIFLARRVFRIAPLFYAMLVYQLLLLHFIVHTDKSCGEIISNVIFIFNFIPNFVDGIVPASWSIGVEMLFYFICPVMMILGRTLRGSMALLVVALFIAVGFYTGVLVANGLNPSFVYHGFLTCSPYFCWGILFYHCFRRLDGLSVSAWIRVLSAWTMLIAGVGVIILLMNWGELYAFFWKRGVRVIWDSIWGMPFGLICVGMALHPIPLVSNVVTRYLGKISFSLYLTHPGIIYYMGKDGVYEYISRMFGSSPIFAFMTSVIVTVAIVGAVSSLTYRWIEVPGMKLGKICTDRMAMRFKAVG